MTDIQWICIWSDVGYQPGGHHVPFPGSSPRGTVLWNLGSSVPNVVMRTTLAQITTMDLPVEYKAIRTATYIAVLITGTREPIYGWIRSIEEIAGRSPACRIEWEIDNWRTFFGMELRRGCTLLRVPTAQQYGADTDNSNIKQGQYREQDALAPINNQITFNGTDHKTPRVFRDMYWVVIQYISGTQTTVIKTAIWPAGFNEQVKQNYSSNIPDANKICILNQEPEGTYQAKMVIPLQDVYAGLAEELFNIPAENILMACVTPFCPFPDAFKSSVWNNSSTQYQVYPKNDYIAVFRLLHGSGNWSDYGYYEADIGVMTANDWPASAAEIAGLTPFQWRTTTNQTAVLTDLLGNVAYVLPHYFGTTQHRFGIGWDFSPNGARMIVHFTGTDQPVESGGTEYAADQSNGLIASIPLPEIQITSNSWSSYVYSGQRNYEIQTAKAEAENAMWKGLANTGTSAMNGAIAGAISGSGVGTAAGAAVGAGFNIAGTLIGAELDAQTRPQVQRLKDMFVARQGQTLLTTGNSAYWCESASSQMSVFVRLVATDGGQWAQDKAENGYHTEYQTSTGIVLSTGPWQISGAVPDGEMPTGARISISRMLAQGVYIDSVTEEEEEEEEELP